jgi:hypothetical protein
VLQISAAELVIGAAAGKGEKHHYIPVFYSREWAGPDGRLCEYTRPYREVKTQWKHPDATGYVRGLYTVPRSEPEVSEHIERHFFRITDNGAAVAAQQLRTPGLVDFANLDRSSWSRFIISLMLRNPEYVAKMASEVVGFYSQTDNEEKYQELREPNDPPTFEEYVASRTFHPVGRMSAYALQKIIDSPTMGGHLNKMRWNVVTFTKERYTLLTSDRPIIMTNGIIGKSDHLALPIGPRYRNRASDHAGVPARTRPDQRSAVISENTGIIQGPPRAKSGAEACARGALVMRGRAGLTGRELFDIFITMVWPGGCVHRLSFAGCSSFSLATVISPSTILALTTSSFRTPSSATLAMRYLMQCMVRSSF